MSKESKVGIRQRDWEVYREYILKCPASKEESVFAQAVIENLREGKIMAIGIDTLMLNVRYGINTSGYARELTRDLEEYGFPYKHRKYLVRKTKPGVFARMMDRVSKMQNEHDIVVFSIPQLSDLRQNISLQLPGEGTIHYVAREGDNIDDLLDFLISPETTEDEKYDRLWCIISDGRELEEISVCSRYLTMEDILNAVKG